MSRTLAAATVAAGTGWLLATRRRARLGGPPGRGYRRLAAWEPASPRAPLARAAAYAWAAPITAAGLLAGAAARARPRVRDGVLLFPHARGVTGRVLRARGFSAGAIGHVIVALDEPDAALLRHELVHVRQAERLGLLMAPLYLGYLAVYGYRGHPLEVAAYRVARRPAAA